MAKSKKMAVPDEMDELEEMGDETDSWDDFEDDGDLVDDAPDDDFEDTDDSDTMETVLVSELVDEETDDSKDAIVAEPVASGPKLTNGIPNSAYNRMRKEFKTTPHEYVVEQMIPVVKGLISSGAISGVTNDVIERAVMDWGSKHPEDFLVKTSVTWFNNVSPIAKNRVFNRIRTASVA